MISLHPRARFQLIGIIPLALLIFLIRLSQPTVTLAQSPPPVYLPIILKPDPSGVSYPPTPEWLQYLNQYRAQALLPSLKEEPTWSEGAWKHARYMVKNDLITHTEDPKNQWYSPEGDTAGRNGNVMISTSFSYTEAQAIDLWLQGPFHALGILHPRLEWTGFGIYHEDIGTYKTGAVMDVLRGRTTYPLDAIGYPIFWPGNRQITWLNRYVGGEYPDPLAPCGYHAPSGLPIIIQLGNGNLSPQIKHSDLHGQGNSLPHCIYTENTYTNPDSSQQNLARSILNAQDAVVLIPQAPLKDGSYTVLLTIAVAPNGPDTTYIWTFEVTTTVTSQYLPETLGDRSQTQ